MSKDFSRWEHEFCRELGESMRPKNEWKPREALSEQTQTDAAYLANWFPSAPFAQQKNHWQPSGTSINLAWANGALHDISKALTASIAAEGGNGP